MKKSFNLSFSTTVFILLVLFVCASLVTAQYNSSFVKPATGLNENANDSLSRQRIVKTTNVKYLTTLDLEKNAFALINQRRFEKNLGALQWSDEVAEIARVHSQNMAKHKFFNHRGIDGSMVDDRAFDLGVKNWQAIGENIAFNCGYENPVEFAVERWMLSASHRENLLSSRWRESAVGVAVGDDGSYYFTQVFLQRK